MLREGSSWKKWNFHVHAPTSALNNQFEGADDEEKWENYLVALEALGDIGAIGITDYMSTDGYEKVTAARTVGRIAKARLIFANVEFRILPVTDSNKAINMHVLASPAIVPELEALLLSRLAFNYEGDPYQCTKDGLARLGRAHAKDATLTDNAARRLGIGQFKVDYTQVVKCFEESKKLRQNAVIAVANSSTDGNSGIQESGLEAVRFEIYRASDVILSGRPADREYFLGLGTDTPSVVITKYGRLKPCVTGCDAHKSADVGKVALDRHTWVKADPTFDGLRQILFEPDSRVYIGKLAPATPPNRLRSVKIDLPKDTVMRWDSGDHPFCLSGTHEIAFAAGLTCIIGGRGAGKSTLINLLHERFAPGTNQFWKDHQLRDSAGVSQSIAQLVSADFAGDATAVEFVSQNEVEDFALVPTRLTKAIYSRLLSMDATGTLRDLAKSAGAQSELGARIISLLGKRNDLRLNIADLTDKISGRTKLLASFQEDAYLVAAERQETLTREHEAIATGRLRLTQLVTRTEDVAQEISAEDVSKVAPYGQAINALRLTLLSAVESVRSTIVLEKPSEEEVRLARERDEARKAIETFLSDRGLSPENISDVASAGQQRAEYEQQLREAREEESRLSGQIDDGAPSGTTRAALEGALQAQLDLVNERFSTGAEEGRRLELRYRFDSEAAEEALIAWLSNEVARGNSLARLRSDHVRSSLEKGGPILSTDGLTLLGVLRKDDKSKASEHLDLYFGREPNLATWNTKRHAIGNDVLQFMRLEALYDGKPLERASFGQRCSAVLIVLLSLGNSPIIVDEPEAHLDSAVIAHFMVDLVKRMKAHRQIIFATHNANFVVNGDAELVHVLTPAIGGASTIESTTLEDVSKRNYILALEGGERAFLQREGRYGLNM